eukprot:scaffold2903_cov170-Amphora_coffeaeformis.AAC.16
MIRMQRASSIVYSLLYLLVLGTTLTTTSWALTFRLDTKVRVHGSSSISVPPPPSHDNNNNKQEEDRQHKHKTSLNTYMTLPVEQYVLVPMPLNSKLSRVESKNHENEFLLQVPPIQFWSLQVQPLVTAQVVLDPDRVRITSNQCRLQSPEESYIERVRLNERFNFSVSCTLTWEDDDEEEEVEEKEEYDNSRQQQYDEEKITGKRMIYAETQIHVNVDPPRPFHRIPKSALEAAGSAAMKVSMNYLIRSFLRGLVQDYHKWASDPTYRTQRASLSSLSSSLVQQYNHTTTTTTAVVE